MITGWRYTPNQLGPDVSEGQQNARKEGEAGGRRWTRRRRRQLQRGQRHQQRANVHPAHDVIHPLRERASGRTMTHGMTKVDVMKLKPCRGATDWPIAHTMDTHKLNTHVRTPESRLTSQILIHRSRWHPLAVSGTSCSCTRKKKKHRMVCVLRCLGATFFPGSSIQPGLGVLLSYPIGP